MDAICGSKCNDEEYKLHEHRVIYRMAVCVCLYLLFGQHSHPNEVTAISHLDGCSYHCYMNEVIAAERLCVCACIAGAVAGQWYSPSLAFQLCGVLIDYSEALEAFRNLHWRY